MIYTNQYTAGRWIYAIRQLEADLEFPHKEKYDKKVTEVMIQEILKRFEKIKAGCAASKPDEFVDVADGGKACEVTDLSETLKSLLAVLDSTILRLRQAKISTDELAAITQELKEAGVTKLSCSKIKSSQRVGGRKNPISNSESLCDQGFNSSMGFSTE